MLTVMKSHKGLPQVCRFILDTIYSYLFNMFLLFAFFPMFFPHYLDKVSWNVKKVIILCS